MGSVCEMGPATKMLLSLAVTWPVTVIDGMVAGMAGVTSISTAAELQGVGTHTFRVGRMQVTVAACTEQLPVPCVTFAAVVPVSPVLGTLPVKITSEAVSGPVLPISKVNAALSLIHISEPTRLGMISYAVF